MRQVALMALAGVVWATPVVADEVPLPAQEAQAVVLAMHDRRGADLKALVELARHPAAPVRVAVSRHLGSLAMEGAAPVLARLSEDRDASVRAAACAASGRLAADLAAGNSRRTGLAEVLRHGLADPDPTVRRAAAWGLATAGLEKSRAWLVARLGRERDATVRAAVLAQLWRVPGKGWLSDAARAIRDPDAGVRFAAAWSLARSGEAAAEAPLRLAAADAAPGVRVAALGAPRRGTPADLWEVAVNASADADAGVRQAALDALAAMIEQAGAPRALPPAVLERVKALVASSDPLLVHERFLAIRLAGLAGCCAPELASVADGEGLWLAGEALTALARQGSGAARARVEAWLASDDESRRRAAIPAAARLAPAGALVVPLLGDVAPSVRLGAVEALQDIAGTPITEALRGRLADADAVVRAAAVEALKARHALPERKVLGELLAKESGTTPPDAAVALVQGLATYLPGDAVARQVLQQAARGGDPVVAREAWAALHAQGMPGPPPEVDTGRDLAYYREVLAWAGEARWLELVTVRGTIVLSLNTADAPLTAFRIAALADDHFYDGLTFHRVVPDFVVQGGDPRGDGWGGPGWSLRDELDLSPYDAGTVGLAHSGPDTAGSQLFVTLTTQPHLVGRYPVLGTVTAGLDVARRIRQGDRILRARSGSGAPRAPVAVWYGPLAPQRLDVGIDGWKKERETYQPQQRWIDLLGTATLRYGLTVAMGTWCSDSREQVPRLQKVLQVLGDRSPFEPPLLIGIDRSKEIAASVWPFGPVKLVPTVTVTLDGTPIGQIAETPSSGSIEEDLARILAPLEGWSLGREDR